MPDIFLKSGAANPNDVTLGDPTASPAVSATVNAAVADASWDAVAATVTGAATVTAALASETWDGQTATISGAATVAGALASESWDGRIAAISGAAAVSAALASETWDVVAAALSGTANVSAALASETWDGQSAVLSGTANVSAAVSDQSWGGLAAVMPQDAAVSAAVADASWDGLAGSAAEASARGIGGGGRRRAARKNWQQEIAWDATVLAAVAHTNTDAPSAEVTGEQEKKKPQTLTRIRRGKVWKRASVPADVSVVAFDALAATVRADANVAAECAACETGSDPAAASGQIINRLAITRHVIGSIQAEVVDGHWRIKKAA
jgi:hypothetical protein